LNPDNKVTFYQCKICKEFSIEACAVAAGCTNGKCKASYDEIVEAAKVETEKNKKFEEAKSAQNVRKSVSKPDNPNSNANSFAKGVLNMLSFGLASKVG